MKENKYDNQIFFEKYSQMDRSKKGLDGAGEWETLKNMLPDFNGKKVLDLGCGYGWHCIYAAQKGAEAVTGVDISEKMLAVAKEKTEFKNVEYLCMPIEDIDFPKNSFDIVISSLAFHYIEDFYAMAKKINDILTDGGAFVFSAEHPIFTSQGSQNWYCNEDGKIMHFPVDNYFYEGKREAVFLGENVVKYHKTLTTYLNGLLKNGFEIKEIIEPMPPEKLMDIPGMKDEMRRPMMIIISAVKK